MLPYSKIWVKPRYPKDRIKLSAKRCNGNKSDIMYVIENCQRNHQLYTYTFIRWQGENFFVWVFVKYLSELTTFCRKVCVMVSPDNLKLHPDTENICFFRRLQNHYISSREEPFSWCCFHLKVSVFWASAVFCLASQTVWSVWPRLTEGCSVRIYLYLAVQVWPRRHDFLHRPTCCMQVVCRLSLRGCLGFSCSSVDLFVNLWIRDLMTRSESVRKHWKHVVVMIPRTFGTSCRVNFPSTRSDVCFQKWRTNMKWIIR